MTDRPSVLAPPPPAQIRAELEAIVLGNILGPEGGEHEELDTSSVSDYYLVGMLAPRRAGPEPADFDGQHDSLVVEGSGDGGEAVPDVGAPPGPTLFSSSMGMTFGLDCSATHVCLEASWGLYERTLGERDGSEDKARRVWRRHPAGGRVDLELAPGPFGPLVPDPVTPGVVVRGRVRRSGGHWVVTAFLVNDQEPLPTNKDGAWLFQAALAATDPDGRASFRRPVGTEAPEDTEEARALAMAYRNQVELVVGHGTGVHAEVDASDRRRGFRVETRAVPVAEVPRTDPPTEADIPALAGVETDMAMLATAPGEHLGSILRPLVGAYESWIAEQQARVERGEDGLDEHREAGAAAVERCRAMAGRIGAGIDLLDHAAAGFDPLAVEAFRFANRAMWLQRVHTLAAERRRSDPTLAMEDALASAERPENHRWRAFQLAFVLVNLPSLAEPTHPERGPGTQGLVDLLWFPTGGGKTEAYLGLSAFTLAIRRLQGRVGDNDASGGWDGSDGVGVLMRYTLRLLTVQQFQRAAALICACERIRQDAAASGDRRLGEVPFRLGLWVGYSVTPTKGTQAARAIEEARGSAWHGGGGASPVQVSSCPWCGSKVDAGKDADHDGMRRRTIVYCGDAMGHCAFSRRLAPGEGLPLVTVDEEIYRLVPAMVIATADKFAQLPWQGATRALFGRVSRRCTRHGWRHSDLDEECHESDSHHARAGHPAAATVNAGPLRPPDLIIQDELHLISGPLGSLMGLYEVAIDALCTWELGGAPIRPKVVASTATVRRADVQAHAVFWRHLEVFPPPGLDASDSFFAIQRDPSVAPGRRYLGVCAPGRRVKAVEIRLYVALMGAAQRLFERYGAAVDPWMTLVGYFSALRELAGMRRMVDDDISTRLSDRAMLDRGLGRRFIGQPQELTSRIDSAKIPEVLDRLGLAFAPAPLPVSEGGLVASPSERGSAGAGRRARRPAGEARPMDVLLATNMISVGVDVPRLGLMVVGGQPKGSAEYIQATSRVGRSAAGPGLVVTALNWARPRDLSHYERFEHFHATFYRHVEALSVTPFAPRALDRGLTGLAVALVRHHCEATNPNAAAQSLNPHAMAGEAVSAILARGAGVTARPEIATALERSLRRRLDSWGAHQHQEAATLGYRQRQDGRTLGLLRQPDEGAWTMWSCPTSLREVEVGVNLLLIEARADGPEPVYEFASVDKDADAGEETGSVDGAGAGPGGLTRIDADLRALAGDTAEPADTAGVEL